MSDGDDERRLRSAFARLREDEAQRAPSLARLRAHAEQRAATPERARTWLRFALPLAGAAAASLAWWISVRAPAPAALAEGERLIAIGSLRSPTDALLAPPIAALPAGFSSSLIPTLRVAPAPAPPDDQQTRSTPARRFPA